MSSTESNRKPLVVCVKYDRLIGKLIRDFVEKHGFRCIQVEDPGDILDYIPDILPGMILTDLSFPRMHGLDMLRQLKADPQTSSIPVIIFSADSRTETIVRGLKIGAEDYVVIPFELLELLARMENILYRRKGLHRTVSRGEPEWMP